MPNIRLDLTGKTYGCLKVLRWDESSYGSHNSRWICECQNCGDTSSVPAQPIKKRPKSCIHCKMLYRKYPSHTLNCTECDKTFSHNNKVKSGQCSDECKRRAFARRMMAPRRADLVGMVSSLLTQVKSRAKRKGLEFDLTLEWALNRLQQQDNHCARTGRKLTVSVKGVSPIAPTTLSFDRINPDKGYTEDNTDIVCYAYNIGKHCLSTEEFENMCKEVLQKAGYVVSDKEGT